MYDRNTINQSAERVKNQVDLVDVVGGYISLEKSGTNYKGSCPFHKEKGSSFVVSPRKQVFHCFNCGIGGDSIKFIMEIEKLSYPEAVYKIAKSHAIEVECVPLSTEASIDKSLHAFNKWIESR